MTAVDLPRRFAGGVRLLAAIALTTLVASACSSSPADDSIRRARGSIFGTSWSVVVLGKIDDARFELIVDGIQKRLEYIDREMSTYKPDSAISRFNKASANEWFEVAPETARVVTGALEITDLTGGAFDVTVGPLVDLWGFGPGGDGGRVPADAELADVRARCGSEHLEVSLRPSEIRKSVEGLQVDLSAIAKGFAVDEVAEYLETHDVAGYMVEIGGEVRTRGRKPDDSPWWIGVEAPVEGRREMHRRLPVVDASLATSGDYRNYFEHEGQRYSHMIDPRTGRPVLSGLASVSVFASTCMHADALATGLMVLGAEAGYDKAIAENLEALFLIRKEDGGFEEKMTPPFAARLEGAGSPAASGRSSGS